MKKTFAITLIALLSASLSQLVHAAPTRTFFIETAKIAASGTVSIDLEYPFSPDGFNTGIRIGIPQGEVFINNANTLFSSTSIGYKGAIKKGLAAYGVLSFIDIDTGPATVSVTDIAIGITLTKHFEAFTANFNAELITDDNNTINAPRGGNNTVFLKSAITFPTNDIVPNSSLIAELILDNNSAVDTTTTLGVRWQPSKRFTIDLILFLKNDTTALAIPGYVKVNLVF